MAVGFGALNIARTGMKASESALSAISHNISNINTKGYSRQQVLLSNSAYLTVGGGKQYGLGVNVQETRQMRSDFLDEIYRKEAADFYYWDTRKNVLQDIEALIAEPMWDGLQEVTNEFWEAWQELSKDPTSLATRSLVRQRGEDISTQLNYLGDQFDLMQQGFDQRIGLAVSDMNKITEKIAMLNLEITRAEVVGNKANDFRDQRSLLLDRLNSYATVKAYEASDGQYDVMVGGYVLVSKAKAFALTTTQTPESGLFNLIRAEYSNEPINIKGGTLGGFLDARGMVLGANDSLSNGLPNARADITFAVEISEDESDEYLEKLKTTITDYIGDFDKRGIDYRLRVVFYRGDEVLGVADHGEDRASFIQSIRNMENIVDPGDYEDLTTAISDPLAYRADVNKYAVIFSPKTLDQLQENINFEKLYSDNPQSPIMPIVVADIEGDENGQEMMGNTKSKLLDIKTEDFAQLMMDLSKTIHVDVNQNILDVNMGDDIIPYVLKNLNAFSNILLREINYIHSDGRVFTEEGSLAEDFFVPIDKNLPLKMGNIMLNPRLDDLDNIATASGDGKGDNNIALQMLSLPQKPIFQTPGRDITSGEFYQNFLMALGIMSGDANRTSENQKSLMEFAENQRQSAMGVSLDEEMSDLLKYKFAYNASSKTLNAIDEMLEIIINRMGRVGR
jgi:flagellar hook-associated protein 1